MKKILFTILITLLLLSISANDIDNLKMFTEEYPPFNFENNGNLEGISIDLITAMLEKSGSSLDKSDITLTNWARGYNTTLKEKNTLIFATTRSEAREKKFKWVGPITATEIVLFKKKGSNITVDNDIDLEKFQIGVIRDDIGQQILEQKGLSDKLQKVATNEFNLKKLVGGRIDLWAYEQNVAKWQIKQAGYKVDDFVKVYSLSKSQLYFAFNLETSDEIINKLQKSLDEIKKSGTHQKIIDKYLGK